MFSTAYETHVLYGVDSKNFGKLCSIILETVQRNPTVDTPKPSFQILQMFLYKPNTTDVYSLEGIMYDCNPFVGKTGFFLFTAPRDNSIIVAKTNKNQAGYDIIQIISNIYLEYLDYIF